MRLLGINGSPHKDGNTCKLIGEVFRGASENGHQCEIVHLIDLHLYYCDWCGQCEDATPGVCRIDDGFMAHVERIFEADVLIVATPSSTHSVTGYMKNWLDRFCNSQLVYKTMQSRLPEGKKAILIVQGCTSQMDATIEPINVTMNVLKISVVEKLVVTKVTQSVEDKPGVMDQAYQIGRSLR